MFNYENLLKTIPEKPGCYLMKDKKNSIVYIGKSKNLKKRVKSYFQSSGDQRAFISLLSDILSDIEVIITKNEYEALQLEANLIRIHKPKFNVIYKDDKNELLIKLDKKKKFPYLDLVRNYKKDGALYIGPFFSSSKIRDVVQTLNRIFKLRTCSDFVLNKTKRVCIEYEIGRCSAPCVGDISENRYMEHINNLEMFLKGKGDEIIKNLEDNMFKASKELLFEKAAKLRDQIKQLKYFLNIRMISIGYSKNIDIWGHFSINKNLSLTIFIIRNGLIIDSKKILYKSLDFLNDNSVISIIEQYYINRTSFPDEIAINIDKNKFKNMVKYISLFKNKNIKILNPERGKILEILNNARENCKITLEKDSFITEKNHTILKEIEKTFFLKNYPQKIECYDNSNIQGENSVASKVEFRDGIRYKKGYKKFIIKTIKGIDDYGMMREILERRLKRGIKENNFPDLIVVDGGKGQLNAALKVLKDLKLDNIIDLLSIAKIKSSDKNSDQHYERVFIPGYKKPIILKPNDPKLILFIKLRDEAHRTAIEFHRKLRNKKSTKSILDNIEGVGAKRKKILLKHFKKISEIKNATLSELESVKGISKSIAKNIFDYFLKN